MTLVKIKARDPKFIKIKNDVVAKLLEWDLNPEDLAVPEDFLALALDEVRRLRGPEERRSVLLELENQLARRIR